MQENETNVAKCFKYVFQFWFVMLEHEQSI